MNIKYITLLLFCGSVVLSQTISQTAGIVYINGEAVSVQASGINTPVYGGCIQNFIAKALDWHSGRYDAVPPEVLLLGDSVTSDQQTYSWSSHLSDSLQSWYSIPDSCIKIHWYGGYSMNDFAPLVDDYLIMSNPDLIVISEFQSEGFDGQLAKKYEQMIQLIRQRTTADIVIATWASSNCFDIYNGGSLRTWSYIADLTESKQLGWLRAIASRYNCELIDFNQALIEWVMRGNDPTTSHPDSASVHVNAVGYAIYNAEIDKHFKPPTVARNTVINPLFDVEEIIYFSRNKRFERFTDISSKLSFGDSSLWTDSGDDYQQLRCSTSGQTMTISFTGIGIEIFYGAANADHSVHISDDDGATWIIPSDYRLSGYPLNFASEVTSITYATNNDTWRLKRPCYHVSVNDTINADGLLRSGQYKITVIDTVRNGANPDSITCKLSNPVGDSIGVWKVGNTAVIGDFTIPAKWNGQDNFYNTDAVSLWKELDEYGFYVYSNWINSFNTTSAGSVKIMGLNNGSHKVRITKNDATQSKFTKAIIYNPILGRM